ncbi:hypothetical protein BDV96DRAFT_229297 [Lophiotrema nucula]|uniref:RING-type E3 ubiquitin transferase n=1 Tax=Lophiotrema nucula TaxID=690887 RepID=A0A6A5YS19_9PLEO|nr:hypothetical protein BDV96DRAFT_229297 [Lophiotrema nucula]
MPPPNTPTTAMDPSNQPQPAAHRDTMFCHECQDEWFRDEHGLTCPECGSDFTEIIEEDNDPRANELLGLGHGHAHAPDDDDDDNDSMPSLEEAPVGQPTQHENPFAGAGNQDGGDRLQWRQLGPGRFAVTGTVYRTFSPSRQGGGDGPPNIMAGFQSMLNNIIGGAAGGNQAAQPQGQEGQGTGSGSGSGTTPAGHGFRYTSNARLFPRDAEHPGPHMEPVDELNNVLVGLMAAFDQGPGGPHVHAHAHGPGDHVHDMPMNPLLALLGGMLPGSGAAGDFVYSQEAMDRIISQLMEQTQTSNAPGPASQQEIDALPRKHISVDMLGPEGRAECSICMDEVNIGEEVTELPCHHWFHHECISAWLGEHDTCPHCRKSISKEGSANSNANAGASSPPNAFSTPNPGSSEEQGSSGGLGERFRRSLFGPPSR